MSSANDDSDEVKELASKVQQFLSHQVESNTNLNDAAKESLTVATECIEQAYGIQRKAASNDLLNIYRTAKSAPSQQQANNGSNTTNNQQQQQQQQQQQFQPNFQQLLQSMSSSNASTSSSSQAARQSGANSQSSASQSATAASPQQDQQHQATPALQQPPKSVVSSATPVANVLGGPLTTTLTSLQTRTYTVHNAFKTIFRTITSTVLIPTVLAAGSTLMPMLG